MLCGRSLFLVPVFYPRIRAHLKSVRGDRARGDGGMSPRPGGSILVGGVAEREENSGGIAKIVLVVRPSKWIAESSEDVINLGRAN